ncbi:radical SAM protein [Bacillus mycoides]|uniref:radical SAM protein n=1 Tax=Bacillus mycoides TaxID=1405 RepID=UPI002E1A4249|nr:radical SAM protein [Bacillus mycoides]
MKRLILTYNQSCNLNCKFCYIDFHHKKIEDKTISIVEQAIQLGFNIITFGGGDSFSKRDFREACKIAHQNHLITHVDTNTLSINESDFKFIEENIDLLGVSIDAIDGDYNLFRDSRRLFQKLNHTLQQLEKYHIEIKVNTILTAQNIDSIPDIFEYITTFNNIKRWSIYQFFPLSSAKKFEDIYKISDSDFEQALKFLNTSKTNLIIEKNRYTNRVDGYIFCDEEGNLYTNNINGKYIPLGSIFNEEDTKNVLSKDTLINPKIKQRYK